MKTQLCEQLSTGTNPFESKHVKFNKDFGYNLLENSMNKKILICNYPFINYEPFQVFLLLNKGFLYKEC